MAWTAEILNNTEAGHRVTFVVRFTDGITIITEPIQYDGGDPDVVKKQIQNRIDALENRPALLSALPAGPVTPIPSDPALLTFLREARQLQNYRVATDSGLLTSNAQGVSTDATYIALRDKLRTDLSNNPAWYDYL